MMGMPITIEVVDASVTEDTFDAVFNYFHYVDEKFSTYKDTSEISAINRGDISETNFSDDMKLVFDLSEKTKEETKGYFDIVSRNGTYDPSGLVKGWSILNASKILEGLGFKNFYVEAGGDIQVSGNNSKGLPWRVGIKNPFNQKEIVKIVELCDQGIATSGTYIMGQHIYNPFKKEDIITDIVSLTIIGPNVYEADRFATAAFAMGKEGVNFIEQLPGLEGYVIDERGVATMTSGFNNYIAKNV